MIVLLWAAFLILFVAGYLSYFVYLKTNANKPWGFDNDPHFLPNVSVLVSVHNEEKVVQNRLRNITEVSYPKEKMEIIIIDDDSSDDTLVRINDFAKSNPQLRLKVIKPQQRMGKARALNRGLKASSSDFVVETDADVVWPPDALGKALSYMVNPAIGAVSGRGISLNPNQSWVTRGEEGYMNFMSTWRLGESKIHSTVRFEGCFSIFRRSAFERFDESGADDSGTALRIVQNGYRAILVPEAHMQAEIHHKIRDRTRTKVRRAVHLAGLWFHCLGLLVGRRLKLPKRIALPEIFLSLFMPFIFVGLVCLTFLLLAYYPIPIALSLALLCLSCLIPRVRSYVVQGILDQFILFYAVLLCVRRKRFVTWEK